MFLVLFVDKVDSLVDSICRSWGWCYFDSRWIGENRLRQFDNSRRHSRWEKEGLSFCGNFCNHFFDIMDKPHIEHSVGFIEDKESNMSQVYIPLVHQIEESSWCRYQDIDTLLECLDLAMLIDSTKDNRVFQFRISSIIPKTLRNLDSEFSCRSQNQTSDHSFARCEISVFTEELNNRDSESSCLTSSSLSDSEEVSVVEDQRNSLALNRCRCRVSLGFEGSENGGDYFEIGKFHETG